MVKLIMGLSVENQSFVANKALTALSKLSGLHLSSEKSRNKHPAPSEQLGGLKYIVFFEDEFEIISRFAMQSKFQIPIPKLTCPARLALPSPIMESR